MSYQITQKPLMKNLTYSNIDQEEMLTVPDQGYKKMLKLAQLGIEYHLYV
jgi:hypothetical protein